MISLPNEKTAVNHKLGFSEALSFELQKNDALKVRFLV